MPFKSIAQEHYLFSHMPALAHRWAMEAKQKGVPLVQPGGVQPYHGSSASHPGMAHDAMRQGTMLSGHHPADAMRAVQRAARRPRSLLESLGR
jgi:hypothetical protein